MVRRWVTAGGRGGVNGAERRATHWGIIRVAGSIWWCVRGLEWRAVASRARRRSMRGDMEAVWTSKIGVIRRLRCSDGYK